MLGKFRFSKDSFTAIISFVRFLSLFILSTTLVIILVVIILVDRHFIKSPLNDSIHETSHNESYTKERDVNRYQSYKTFTAPKYLDIDSFFPSLIQSSTSTNELATQPVTAPITSEDSPNSTTDTTSNSLKSSIKVEDAFLNDGKKTAYLTFDDGPSTTVTPKVLEILKNYNIRATFFLVGNNIEKNAPSRNLVNTIYSDGNSIGNHTYSHDLKKLYPNNKIDTDYFMSEVYRTNSMLKDILGNNFQTRLIRLPGGYMSRNYYHDPNLPVFGQRLEEEKYVSVDWNASDSDAEGKRKNAQELLQMVKESVGNKSKVIILMHDTYGKEETAKALPSIIDYLKSQGYEFKALE